MKRAGRMALAALATISATGIVGVAAASPASAASCTANGSYSFRQSTNPGYNTIWVYNNKTCSGSDIGSGRVKKSGSNMILSVYDNKCDNTGFHLYTHGPSVTSTGCGNQPTKTVALSSFGYPRNFWVNIDGTQINSPAMNFPS
ncbi:hypothetical protein [Actinoplanes teichomyceticus]|uniref:Peptidase inhibitor family I36 n=1 Tax=Actinoplanes teichomyceticus TaxID=1867 RepID=A0A561VLY3_ACTTI|nr:hypothetical protein [Actinoplanes teichomyceticus]TWG12610.1 hypothetical protein FHX34_105477 [Actinoplanes teichomyceticus]GIF13980.1 hypothetical protein Ate01nite_40120 [Actinoplanes teichomyceticus]